MPISVVYTGKNSEELEILKIVTIILCILLLLIPFLTAVPCYGESDKATETQKLIAAFASLRTMEVVGPHIAVSEASFPFIPITVSAIEFAEQQVTSGGSTRGVVHTR